MKEAFIPLVLTSTTLPRVAAPPPPLQVLPKPETAPAFPTLPETASTPLPKQEALPPIMEPNIILQRDGDRVTCIQVKCACGQVIEVACSY